MAPIAEAMPKLSSKLQAAGEQRFTNDLPEPVGCLYAAYVLIPRARAVLVGYDLAAAREMPGFVDVVSAEDIPGKNTCEMTKAQLLLVPKGEASQFAGSPCLVVLADSTKHAEAAARAVELHLELPQEAPVLSIEACVERQQEADDGKRDMDSPVVKKKAKTVVRGNAAKALEESAHRVQGKVACDGQKAFYMEPPCALVTPGEDSTLTVWGSYQVPSWAHAEVAATSGLPKHKILMNATHIGGGFGGKLTKPLHAVCAASVAALKTRRPVRFHVNRNVDTVVCAGRHPMSFEYDVGFDAAGKLSAVQAVIHADAGLGDACSGFSLMIATQNMEQIYGIPHLDIEGIMCTTDKPGNTAVRGPGEPQAALFIETIIEHVAAELGKDSQEVREANIFTSPADMAAVAADPTSPEVEKYSAMLSVDAKDCAGRDFKNFPALGIWTSLKEKTDYAKRAAATAAFNQEHRFRKRGLAMTPVKYAVGARNQQATVCLYTDGTCLISCDGTEIGQGLHTKVIQYASYYLSQLVPGCAVPLKDIRVGPNGTDKIAHGSITGGSTTSEGVCEAVRDAIGKLKENLQPTREKLEASGKEITLVGLLGAASGSAELQASGKNHNALDYHCFGAALSEVEIDVMTGEVVILSTSIMYDCGKSLNPTIDLGQAEGAFMMGVGFYLRERLIQDSVTGKLATDGTWEYKIPCAQDVPLKFDVEFFPRAFTEGGISSSKASGEPPLVLASSVFAAVKQAIRAGRKEFGTGDGNFRLDAPCTPRDIALAVGAAMDCR
uniref:Aldehyde oxidase/xanthine dehydrogenase a/b hammerhead domain-containing protein n=1 Tax=Zooxanthella nutricula TaxID=1333877 RepID=A0A7S2KL86_9DINO